MSARSNAIRTLRRLGTIGTLAFVSSCIPSSALAEENVPPAPQVLATVDGREITDADVRLAILLQVPEDDPRRDSEGLRRQTLFALVQRALAADFLASQNVAPAPAEVDLEVERRRKAFAAVERSWDEELRKANVGDAAVRELLGWRLAWSRYLDRSLTEANLEKYFERFRWRFDGSRRRVAHLLLKCQDGPEDRERAISEAKALRGRIVAGDLAFDDAVRQHSQAESAADGGDLGWIEADGPMPDAFNRAAFALATGEISEPVVTPFGVHLIQCKEIEAGTRTYQDVRAEVADFAREDLFRWIVERRLPTVQIEFEGNETLAEFERSLAPSLLGTSAKSQ